MKPRVDLVQDMRARFDLRNILRNIAPSADKKAIDSAASEILLGRLGLPWERPQQTWEEVDGLRRQVRALQARISELDPRAASFAREHAHRAREPEVHAGMTYDEREAEYYGWMREADEKEMWVDNQTIAALDRFDRALSASMKAAAEAAAFQKPGDKRGRTPNWEARMVALRSAQAWLALTGEVPDVSLEKPYSSTPFGQMLADIFRALRIRCDRRPVEWLIEQIRENSSVLFA